MFTCYYTACTNFGKDSDLDSLIIQGYNLDVHRCDIIYHLGNFVSEDSLNSLSLVKDINCDVILIVGDNERHLIDSIFNSNFNEFKEYALSCGFVDIRENSILSTSSQSIFMTFRSNENRDSYLNLHGESCLFDSEFKPLHLICRV